MRSVTEVESMVYEQNLTVKADSIERITEIKTVNKLYQEIEDKTNIICVYQKKKGKPTKKITAFGIFQNGHFSRIVYALLTTDSELKELLRNANSK